MNAAKESPVYKLAIDWKLALPLHPEYRTLPMVWYVPPLSPVQSAADAGKLGMNGWIPDLKSLRIPIRYLANLLTAGDEAPVILAMERLLAMRAWRRAMNVDGIEDIEVLTQVGLTVQQAEEMYRYLAIANYEDRFVIPTAHKEYANDAFGERGGCLLLAMAVVHRHRPSVIRWSFNATLSCLTQPSGEWSGESTGTF